MVSDQRVTVVALASLLEESAWVAERVTEVLALGLATGDSSGLVLAPAKSAAAQEEYRRLSRVVERMGALDMATPMVSLLQSVKSNSGL